MYGQIASGSLLWHLGRVPDPRSRRGRRYPLGGLLGMLILAALRLLRALPLEGKLVIADAGLLGRPVVKTVVAEGGGYLGPVKDNQPALKQALEEWMTPDLSPPGPGTPGR